MSTFEKREYLKSVSCRSLIYLIDHATDAFVDLLFDLFLESVKSRFVFDLSLCESEDFCDDLNDSSKY